MIVTEQQNDSENANGGTPEIQGVNPVGDSFARSQSPKKANPMKLRFLSAAALVVVGISAGFLGGWLSSNRGEDANASVRRQQVVLKTQGQLISNIAKEVGESVVSVEVTSTSAPSDGFFGFQGTTEQQSAGTGIIIDKQGLIITNRHVVPAGTTNVSVTLSDGTKFEDVDVLGRTNDGDPLDIAFLKIKDTKGKDLKAAVIGESGKMKVGDPVVAIGNALGEYQNTISV
ncbi:MAG: trypsin-like peptidase domain-containing protein, partial [Patescibacteria group bacterium]